MTDPIRLGCIGTGNICRGGHLPQYAQLPEYVITAFYDTDPAAARLALAEYRALMEARGRAEEAARARVCPTAEALLEQVDAVDVCTSLRWHAYYAALALEKGVGAMSEKPMARTWLEADRVAQNAGKSKGFYQLNDDNLFIPRFLAAKALVDAGWIGDVCGLRIARGSPSSARAAWFYDPIESGGGAILDYGSHAVTGAWAILGFDKRPVTVRSLGIATREKTRVVEGRLKNIAIDDDAHFKVLFQNPANGDWIDACIEATWTYPHFGAGGSDVDGYLEIEGSLGRLSGCRDEAGRYCLKIESRTLGRRLVPVEEVGSEEYSFLSEFRNFARATAAGRQPFLSAETGADTIAVINAAQLSERRGREAVELEALKRYSREFLGRAGDVWSASDALVAALNEPYLRG